MLDGKKIAILAEEDFEDSEIIEPLRSMKSAGAKVVIIGSGSQEIYKGKRGTVVIKVDTTADKVNTEDYDAIIIPGGYASDKMMKSFAKLIREREGLNVLPASTAGLIALLEGHRQDPLPNDRYVVILTGRK